ncbi:hypothetical protein BC831DRAFT_502722 [Entophlyctis helioformis]|nr:hypothetical protein BC831DRAFT_502722 [Entophlyctis helioformis]
MQAGGRPFRDIHWTGRTRPHLNNAVVISHHNMDCKIAATEQDASVDPVFTDINIFVQVSILDTLCCAIKIPLISAISWFLSSLFLTLDTLLVGNTTTQLTVYSWLSLVADLIASSTLLWFTLYRTLTVWHNAAFLEYLTAAIQLAQLAGAICILWEQLPESLLMATGATSRFDIAISAYAATDLLATTMDIILMCRLWVLNKQLSCLSTSRNRQLELVKPRFFHYSVACVLVVIALSIAMATLFATGLDPFFGFNTTLFAFRIFLTDVFSNLMRDSLIEAHVQQLEGWSSVSNTVHCGSGDPARQPMISNGFTGVSVSIRNSSLMSQ